MNLRALSKAIIPMLAMAAVLTVLSGDASARWSFGGGGSTGGTSGGVPEIDAGTAASAVALLSGAAYLVKNRFSRTQSTN